MTTTTVQALYAFRGIYGDCGEDEAQRFAESYCGVWHGIDAEDALANYLRCSTLFPEVDALGGLERFFSWRKLAREAFAESAYAAEPAPDGFDRFFIFLSV